MEALSSFLFVIYFLHKIHKRRYGQGKLQMLVIFGASMSTFFVLLTQLVIGQIKWNQLNHECLQVINGILVQTMFQNGCLTNYDKFFIFLTLTTVALFLICITIIKLTFRIIKNNYKLFVENDDRPQTNEIWTSYQWKKLHLSS